MFLIIISVIFCKNIVKFNNKLLGGSIGKKIKAVKARLFLIPIGDIGVLYSIKAKINQCEALYIINSAGIAYYQNEVLYSIKLTVF